MNKPKQTKLPYQTNIASVLKVVATAYFVWLTINYALGGLAVLVQVFNMSIAVGIVLVAVGGIGIWLAFAGSIVTCQGMMVVWMAFKGITNPYEYFAKLIGASLAMILLSLFAYIAGNAALGYLGNWLTSFIK